MDRSSRLGRKQNGGHGGSPGRGSRPGTAPSRCAEPVRAHIPYKNIRPVRVCAKIRANSKPGWPGGGVGGTPTWWPPPRLLSQNLLLVGGRMKRVAICVVQQAGYVCRQAICPSCKLLEGGSEDLGWPPDSRASRPGPCACRAWHDLHRRGQMGRLWRGGDRAGRGASF